MTTPDKLKELKNIVIYFNEYLETVAEGLGQPDIGVKVIVDNLRVEIEELSKETEEIMQRDLEQGTTVVAEMLKVLCSTKYFSSTNTTTSFAKPSTSQTTKNKELSSSGPFLEKEKRLLEFKAKLLSKKNYSQSSIQNSIF